jgi:CheY-like chemotaxis protein
MRAAGLPVSWKMFSRDDIIWPITSPSHNRIYQRMTRPCFLVVDHEYSGSISTRKLVIETAKFNVLTAYSANEAIETLRRFPAVDGIVTDAEMPDMPCADLVRALKTLAPAAPVILVRRPMYDHCREADHQLESFDPRRLLELLEKLCPDHVAAAEKRNEDLKAREK